MNDPYGRITTYIGSKLKKRLESVRKKQSPIPSESAIVRVAIEFYIARMSEVVGQ